MLGFETLTLAPIDLSLIEPKLLEADEIAWLNDYHARVRKTLSPRVRFLNPLLAREGHAPPRCGSASAGSAFVGAIVDRAAALTERGYKWPRRPKCKSAFSARRERKPSAGRARRAQVAQMRNQSRGRWVELVCARGRVGDDRRQA